MEKIKKGIYDLIIVIKKIFKNYDYQPRPYELSTVALDVLVRLGLEGDIRKMSSCDVVVPCGPV